MRRLAVPLVLVALAMPAAADEGNGAPPSLRIVSYNILHGRVFSGLVGDGQDLERRLELAAAELRALATP